MPRIRPTELPASFTELAPERAAHNEQRDCTVVALTLTTGRSYADCHKALADAGRKSRSGAYQDQWEAAANALGFHLRRWTSAEVIAMIHSYPRPHDRLHGITTHHPRRFAKQWAGTGKILMQSRGHISACIDGIVADWAINRSKRVIAVFTVEPISQ